MYLSGRDLDGLYRKLLDDHFALNTVKYVHRTLSVALEHARKQQMIRDNPASCVLTKFKEEANTPDPYTLEQTRTLIKAACDTQWELVIVLAALYGLRRGEVLGLTLRDVDLKRQTLSINKQRNPIPGNDMFAPVKEHSSNRILPITDETKRFFERRILEIKAQKLERGAEYQNNDLLICKPDGSPYEQTHISRNFNSFLCHIELPHIRFHDLRHTAATNMHQLTGDFLTVGAILGHSLKGIGQSLNISGLGRNATDRYIDIRMESMKAVLNAYHKALLQTDENGAAERSQEAQSI